MNTPPTRSENPEASPSAGTKPRNGTSGNQDSVRARRAGTILKALVAAVLIIAVSVAIYFLAIYPRVRNSKELAVAAAAGGKDDGHRGRADANIKCTRTDSSG